MSRGIFPRSALMMKSTVRFIKSLPEHWNRLCLWVMSEDNLFIRKERDASYKRLRFNNTISFSAHDREKSNIVLRVCLVIPCRNELRISKTHQEKVMQTEIAGVPAESDLFRPDDRIRLRQLIKQRHRFVKVFSSIRWIREEALHRSVVSESKLAFNWSVWQQIASFRDFLITFSFNVSVDCRQDDETYRCCPVIDVIVMKTKHQQTLKVPSEQTHYHP